MICIENSYYPCTEITYNLASTCSKPHRESSAKHRKDSVQLTWYRLQTDVSVMLVTLQRSRPSMTGTWAHSRPTSRGVNMIFLHKSCFSLRDATRSRIPFVSMCVCLVGWGDFREKTGTRQVVTNCSRTEIPKFYFEMLLFFLAQATANFDSFLKMGSPQKTVYVFEREGLLFYA